MSIIGARWSDQVDDATSGEKNPHGFAPRHAVVAERDAHQQRKDGNSCAEQCRADDSRQRESFDEEELIEDDAEQTVERKARVILLAYLLNARNGALQDEEGNGRAADAESDECRARQSTQGDLADYRPR